MKPALFGLLAIAVVIVGLALLALWDGLREKTPPHVDLVDPHRYPPHRRWPA